MFDNRRWEHFVHRPGDIFVCTPPKCGTTWTQTIVASLLWPEGDAPGQFRDPCGVAVGDDGRVYVADTWNHRIQKLSAKGEPIAEWAAGFYGPRGIALDHAGRIYVADTGNRRVVRLSAAGVAEREWGRTGDALSSR